MAYKTTILCVFLEILFFLISVIIAVVATHLFLHKVDGLQPFKRGFFCDDDSIKYPVKKDSLSILDIIKVGVVVSLGLILTIELEIYYIKRQDDTNNDEQNTNNKCGPLSIPSWIVRLLHRMCIFSTGLVLMIIFFITCKVLIGRLRPHFLAVCKPNNTLYNCSDGYITADVCTGDPLLVKRARSSMPSGHAALAFYFAVFITLAIQALVYLRKYKIFRMIVQSGVLLLACYAGISRITNNAHHVTDVLVGGLVGSFAAWLVVFQVMRLFHTSREVVNDDYRRVPSAPLSTG